MSQREYIGDEFDEKKKAHGRSLEDYGHLISKGTLWAGLEGVHGVGESIKGAGLGLLAISLI